MDFRAIAILLLVPLLAGDGDKQGRRGNELYKQEQYDLAVEAYYGALAALKDSASPWLPYALQNNLGAALLKSGDAAAAREAFGRAIASAPAPGDAARTEYNAGNAAFEERDLQQALNHYRQSLLKNPDNVDAKFNYEYVKRQQQQQQQQNQQNQQNQDKGDQEQQSQNQGDQNQEQQQENQEQKSDQENGQGEQQQDPQQSDQPEDERDQQPPREQEGKLSQQQAERILEALENEEEQLLRQVQRMKSKPRRVEKDW